MIPPVRVIKIGGSLFEFADVGTRIDRWLNTQPPARNVLIAGGGKLANAIRDADRVHRIGDRTGHWMCIQLLDVSAQLLDCLTPNTILVRDYTKLETVLSSSSTGRFVLSVEDFMRNREAHLAGVRLSHDWRTTTDAIAARVASALGAGELVLVKSCDLSPGLDRHAAAEKGLVDQVLPDVAHSLKLRWVNLRGDTDTSRSF